jgi:hypothetical protein
MRSPFWGRVVRDEFIDKNPTGEALVSPDLNSGESDEVGLGRVSSTNSSVSVN